MDRINDRLEASFQRLYVVRITTVRDSPRKIANTRSAYSGYKCVLLDFNLGKKSHPTEIRYEVRTINCATFSPSDGVT